ncbi:segregation/condensation protein A [Streptomyces sp. WG5]|uniref:segregation and condensation protein A n=1 Tax=Streptomyces sp. WG5 TaxID=3417648 RepID=UPI003CF92E33
MPREPAVARPASEAPPASTASEASSRSDATSPQASLAVSEPEAERPRREPGTRGASKAPATPRPDSAPQPPAAGPDTAARASAAGPRTGERASAAASASAPQPSLAPETAPQASAGAPEGSWAAHGPGGRESGPQGAPQPDGAAADAAPSQAPPRDGSDDPEGAPGDGGDGVFKVRLANFEGPFDLLLQLISKHKMDVTEVALSRVTDEFMAHIRARGPDWDLDETTEFLVVAATLLDLKAARLLPAAEVEDEADLALLEARDLLFARLLQYRAYKQIAEIFNERLEAEGRRHPRTVGLEPHHAELLPEVVISIGPEGFARLAVKAMQPRPKPQVYVEHIHAPLVSVQEQAGIVVARLRELGEASFRTLVEDTEDTLTVVARFLALLELYREKAVELDQETALGDLLVRWAGGDGGTGPVVTDEFDRPPEKTEEERKA